MIALLPRLRLLLWHHEDTASMSFRFWLADSDDPAYLNSKVSEARPRQWQQPPSLRPVFLFTVSLSLSFSLPLIHGCHGLFLDFDCQELLNQIRRLCLSVSHFLPLGIMWLLWYISASLFQLHYWSWYHFLLFGCNNALFWPWKFEAARLRDCSSKNNFVIYSSSCHCKPVCPSSVDYKTSWLPNSFGA